MPESDRIAGEVNGYFVDLVFRRCPGSNQYRRVGRDKVLWKLLIFGEMNPSGSPKCNLRPCILN